MPTPAPPGAQLSPDGAWWWDGQVWRPRAAAPAYGYPAAAPAKRGLPTWAIVLIVVVVVVLLLPILAAIAIPVFLNQRAKAEELQVHQDLSRVAKVETDLLIDQGAYSSDPTVVSSHLTEDLTTRVTILWADETGWCASGAVPGKEPVAWYSAQDGLSDTPCG
jgi:Tfp pilus assembly major pilin PilA